MTNASRVEDHELLEATDELNTTLGEIRAKIGDVSNSMNELADGFEKYEAASQNLADVTSD